jgi:hypothetical protein
MAKTERNPWRDKTREHWLDGGGTATLKELADLAGVSRSLISKWKATDGWAAALSQKERGGQPGNKNAVGAGAPERNTNAEKHGAYSTVHLDSLSPEERAYVEGATLDTQENMLRELQLLMAKESDLKRRAKSFEGESPDTLHVDRVIETRRAKSKDGDEGDDDATVDELLKPSMETTIKVSPFDREMRLEAELNKTHGRILKLLDSIKSYELESRRLELEERKYRLAKQKLKGEYEVDPATGEIDDLRDDEPEE